MRRVELCDEAEHCLRQARIKLREAGAKRAATYVNGAIKSVQGARRHALQKCLREERERDAK